MADSIEPTPTQPDALAPASEPKADGDLDGIVTLTYVKDKTTTSLPLAAKLAHLLAVVVSGVVALFVSAVLADGRSVIQLKDVSELPRITDPALVDKGLDYRADELLGPSYGVGLHHDSSGYTWTEAGAGDTLQTYIDELGLYQVIAAVPSVIATDGLKHPVHFLDCHELKKAGLSAMGLGFIAEIVAALMIIFHGAALVGMLTSSGLSAKITKILGLLVWLTLVAGFLIVICLALAVMENTWTCDNPFIPKVKLADHFVFTYGLGFGYAGYVSSLLVFTALLFMTSTKDGVERPSNANVSIKNVDVGPSPMAALPKAVGVLTIGLVTCAVFSLSVAGGEGAFKDNDYMYYDPEANPCEGQKPYHAGPGDHYFKNVDCMKDGLVQVLEQAGANVTKGFVGGLDAGTWRKPITDRYKNTDLCPVNVHWHLGAEHLSVGEYDEAGKGPEDGGDSHVGDCASRRKLALETGDHMSAEEDEECIKEEQKNKDGRRLAGSDVRLGWRCHHYDETDKRYTTEYDWKYCTHTKVGETYEVHWPHSAAGACGTKWQYQHPFYDGVFCKDGVINILTPLNTYEKIGVQAQVFTIINDESFYHGNLMEGMIVSDVFGHGQDMAMYTGSTTGTSRDAGHTCSRYAPITWQVDRKCHLISASSFDQMCKVMLEQADDMSGDVFPHGARDTVWQNLTADNQYDKHLY